MKCSVCERKIEVGEKFFNENIITKNGNKQRKICFDCLMENLEISKEYDYEI